MVRYTGIRLILTIYTYLRCYQQSRRQALPCFGYHAVKPHPASAITPSSLILLRLSRRQASPCFGYHAVKPSPCFGYHAVKPHRPLIRRAVSLSMFALLLQLKRRSSIFVRFIRLPISFISLDIADFVVLRHYIGH